MECVKIQGEKARILQSNLDVNGNLVIYYTQTPAQALSLSIFGEVLLS